MSSQRIILLGIFVVFATIAAFFLLSFGEKESFPGLASGSYVGTVSGLNSDADTQQYGFYIERLANQPTVLAVIFDEGFTPQFISLEPLADGSRKDAVAQLHPLDLKYRNHVLSFSGSSWLGAFRGKFRRSGSVTERGGSWSLSPVTKSDFVSGDKLVDGYRDTFEQWLQVRNQYLLASDQLKNTEQALRDSSAKVEKLSRLLNQEQTLRARADARKEELAGQIKQLGSDQEAGEKALSSLVSELDLLGRITQRGKAVTLARKVAHRENNWYLANWRTEEDQSGLDEFLEGGSVDLKEVERELKVAQEKRALLAEVSAERRKIAELERTLTAPPEVEPTEPAPSNELPPPAPTERRSLWDRILG